MKMVTGLFNFRSVRQLFVFRVATVIFSLVRVATVIKKSGLGGYGSLQSGSVGWLLFSSVWFPVATVFFSLVLGGYCSLHQSGLGGYCNLQSDLGRLL